MNKKITLLTIVLSLPLGLIHAQNVGIGINIPTAKLHVEQLATSTTRNIFSDNAGLGRGLEMNQSNGSVNAAAIFIRQNGNGAFARGVDINMTANTINYGQTIFNSGTGGGLYIDLSNNAATQAGIFMQQSSITARGMELNNSNAASTGIGVALFQRGTGRALYVDASNTASTNNTADFFQRGLGSGIGIGVTNAANPSAGFLLNYAGIGRGQEISLSNTANGDVGIAIFHSGDGGIGQYIGLGANANRTSNGILIAYGGTNTAGTGGGGNAAEIQHNGNNGNAVDVFMGNPAAAAGPANTTSEYTALSISHMATGTSPSAGRTKAAISASNYSQDPTLFVQNLSATSGAAIEAYFTPSVAAAALSTAIYGRADRTPTNGYGVAIWGDGGNYGVIGGTSTNAASSNFGMLSLTNSGAFGIKSFIIDYPLDPTQKTLRHFSVESDEVLNMYRGVVTLDANGQATVQLPEYFDAINTNVTYQLTAIGSSQPPYVATEVANNQFGVAGAPNTKVSWTVHAQRNDPTIQYFEAQSGTHYRSAITDKKPNEQGKYLVPQAYGAAANQGIFYNADREKNAQEATQNYNEATAVPTATNAELKPAASTEVVVPQGK